MNSSNLIIDFEEDKGITIAILKGVIDSETCDQYNEVLGPYFRSRTEVVTIDCEELTYINSRGMGLLMEFHRQCTMGTGKITLCNVNDTIFHILERMGIPEVIRVFPSREAAVDCMSHRELEIRATEEGSISVVNLIGAVDASSVGEYDEHIRPLVEDADKGVLIDCSRLMFLNSRAMGHLLEFHKASDEQHSFFGLCSVDSRVGHSLEQLGIMDLLNIFTDRDSALKEASAEN